MSEEDKGTEDTGSEDTSSEDTGSDDTSEDTTSENGEGTEDKDTGDDASTDDDSDVGEGDDETPEQKIERLENTNKQLHARLKKPAKPQPTKESNQSDYFEEGIELIASGVDKELVKEIKVQAKDKGISLDEARKLPIITSYETQLETQKKSDDASLPASGKSAPAKDESEFKSGMTRDDHKKAWEKAQ